jgi:hypothetical protein
MDLYEVDVQKNERGFKFMSTEPNDSSLASLLQVLVADVLNRHSIVYQPMSMTQTAVILKYEFSFPIIRSSHSLNNTWPPSCRSF